MKRLKFLTFVVTPIFLVSVMSASVSAQTGLAQSNSANEACAGVSQISSSQSCSSGGVTLKSIISTVVKILSLVLGGIAVIMIIVGGIRYAASAGDANAVSAAKKTLIYAILGLVIAVLAQVIIHWVLGTATGLV